MDIERLKELKQQVFDDFQLYEVKMQNSFEENMKEVTPTGEMDEAGNDLTSLIDAEIARQSVKSEDVAEAIELFDGAIKYRKDQEEEVKKHYGGKLPDFYLDLNRKEALAITALQAYQPWIPVSERLPEKGSHYLCCEYDIMAIFVAYYSSSGWQRPLYRETNVTHWKPLPEPSKGE